MKKAAIISLLVFGLIGLVVFDPAITKTVKFADYSADYDWRIFNNVSCTIRTGGHCYTNEINRRNAELELYHRMISDYQGQKEIKDKLEGVVNSTYSFRMVYSEVADTSAVDIGLIIRYKDMIFKPLVLK